MKHRVLAVFVAIALLTAALPAVAQTGYCSVKGEFKGPDGKPLADVQVTLHNNTTNQEYHLKTDKKGEFYSLGITPGQYNILFLKDGKPVWKMDNYTMSLQKENALNVINVDLQKEYANAPKVSEEDRKKQEEAIKENNNIKNLNEMLRAANTAKDAGNLDEAISIYTKASQTDATRPLIWALLADATLASGKKETDSAAKKQKFESAAGFYKKAIDLAPASTDPKVKTGLGGYYNNYGEALGKSGKTAEAVAAYQAAAVADPSNAGMYFFNEGATMENAFKIDEAVAAYDKAIAADPTRADTYYRKGIALLGKATTNGNKMVAPPGTAEAFNKYLELAPDGPNAQGAKDMLAAIGATVQTSYGTKGATKKK